MVALSREGHLQAEVVAALGPTNTGKTHRAIERMLEHESGMMGLPLRLLAREVYDRVTARVGEEAVALITGEERRIPARAAYWICTVEAMPSERIVDFLAVDEVQLAEHRERGHMFTERLLEARGRRETWFLGSHTMAPILRQMVPAARMESVHRLSQLRHLGGTSLRGLPPRSAVVAFSAAQVYDLAERLRALRGGVAVVLGALSPRTRNAQVAMFQAGEVRYLVATDAIGMGLNLDVDHVAFAGLSKFDGAEQRPLTAAEMAQIAGRAGRYVRDGTFGTLKPLPPLPAKIVSQIEEHRFAPVRSLVYRNNDLNYASLDELIASLRAPPTAPYLRRVEQADDFAVLKYLSSLPEVQSLAASASDIELLWQICQVPNFRRQVESHHGTFLLQLYRQLHTHGELDCDFCMQQMRPLDNTAGDIPTLVERLEGIRVWAYTSQRPNWLSRPEPLQQMARDIEDRLGDALHARLVERFVKRTGPPSRRRVQRGGVEAKPVAGPFAQLSVLREQLAEQDELHESEDAFVARIEAATFQQFVLDSRLQVEFEGEPIARLLRGKDWVSPAVALREPELWSAGARRRVERRLLAFTRDLVALAGGGQPRLMAGALSAEGRGLAYMLQQELGILRRHIGHTQAESLPPESRSRFVEAGFVVGHRHAYLEGALDREAMDVRMALASLWAPLPALVGELRQAAYVPAALFENRDSARMYGYDRVSGGLAFRIDLVEQLASLTIGSGGKRRLQSAMGALAMPEPVAQALLAALGLSAEALTVSTRRKRPRRRRRRGGQGQSQAAGQVKQPVVVDHVPSKD